MKKILIDMDGVLVDFVRGCFSWFNRTDIQYMDITWNLEQYFGINPGDFWNSLTYDFWANLPWHPSGRQLFANLESHFGVENLVICTSPSRTPGCIEGKMEWLKRELPLMERQFMITPQKHFAASPDRILLDDHEPNIEKFAEAGGHTVLVHQPWNKGKERLSPLGDYCPFEIFAHTVNKNGIEK